MAETLPSASAYYYCDVNWSKQSVGEKSVIHQLGGGVVIQNTAGYSLVAGSGSTSSTSGWYSRGTITLSSSVYQANAKVRPQSRACKYAIKF